MSRSIYIHGPASLDAQAMTGMLELWSLRDASYRFKVLNLPGEPLGVHLFSYGHGTRGIYLYEQDERGLWDMNVNAMTNLSDREAAYGLLITCEAGHRPRFICEDSDLSTRSVDAIMERSLTEDYFVESVRTVLTVARRNHYVGMSGVVRQWCIGPDYLKGLPEGLDRREEADMVWDVFVRSQYDYPDLPYPSRATINGFEHPYDLLGPDLEGVLIGPSDRYAYASEACLRYVDFYSLRDLLPSAWALFDQRQILIKRPLTGEEQRDLEDRLCEIGTESQPELEEMIRKNKQAEEARLGLVVKTP